MQKIKDIANNYFISPVNAVITENYITPGINGQKVDELSSYYSMKNSKNFSEDLLVFEEIKPEVSITNNKDKIINHGNINKNNISLIVNNNLIKEYCIKSNIVISYKSSENICLIDFDDCNNDSYKIESSYEINNESILFINITPGDIIYISDDLTLDMFKHLLRIIKYRNLKIIDINNLISESS